MTMLTRLSLLFMSLALVGTLAAPSPASQSRPRAADLHTTEANVTRLASGLLGRSQFSHHPLDTDLAGRLLEGYLDGLDGSHSLFLQSDVDGFSPLRSTLAETTLTSGDTSVAHAIFARYLERLEQQVAYVSEALRTERFDFTGHDSYSFDREHAPRPADLAAAKRLWHQQLRSEYLQEKLADKPPEQIVSTLTRRRQQQLRSMKGFRDDEVLEIYLNALAHVYDPHSDYLGHEAMENFSIAMNLSLVGIGASLESEDGYCKIRELLAGGPARRSGLLQEGDRIVAVAQAGQAPVDIVDMPLSRAVDLIRGPKGSSVVLTIVPGNLTGVAVPRTVALVRDEIKLADQEAKARILDLPTEKGATLRLGEIDLPSFYAGGGEGSVHRSATKDVARLLAKLKAERVQGIVLDLRRNGGGSLEEAISLTGLFIRQGPVVQTRDPAGQIEVGADDDPRIVYDGPLVLLTSRFSASATEILAGALQDYGRAVVVGDTATFGKGTVQTIVQLARLMDLAGLGHSYDPGALKVTISKFYRPSGASTQLRGVASDIVLPSTTDFAQVSESALKDPLPWDVVPAASYQRMNRVQPFLNALKYRSSLRVKTEQDFAYVGDDFARLSKQLATKSLSLNEAERRAEATHEKTRQSDRERERHARGVAPPVAYDITLENVDVRGLPPAAVDTPTKAVARGSSATAGPAIAPAHDGERNDATLTESLRILADYTTLASAPKEPGTIGAL